MADLDFMVRRNTADSSSIPNTGSGPLDLPFDNQVAVVGSAITYSTPNFTLVDTGLYLVLWSDNYTVTSQTDAERQGWRSYLRLNGADIVEGRCSGFIRKNNTGSSDYIVSGFAIINVSTANQTLLFRSERFDNSTTGPATRAPSDRSGVTIIKLDDADAYARYVTTSGKATATGNGSEASIVWDSNDEQDTGFSRTTDSITITNAGRYFVSYSIPLFKDGGNRAEFTAHIELDTVEVPGTRTQTYIRGSSDAANDGCLSWGGIIDVAADDVLVLRHIRIDGESTTINYLSGSNIQLWRLPTDAEVCIVEATTGDFNTAATDFAWDTIRHIDAAAFTHTAGNSNVDVDVADDYLVFVSQARNTFSSALRAVPAVQFRVNTTDNEVCGGSSYNRNSTAGFGAINCGGLLTGLSANDSIRARNDRLGTTSTSMVCQTGQMSLLRLGSLAAGAPSGAGAQTLPSLNQAGVGRAEAEGAGAQNLPPLTQAGAGIETFAGSGANLLAAFTQSGIGAAEAEGAGAQTLASLIQAGVGVELFTGAGTQTLASLLQTGVGGLPPAGIGASLLPAITQAGLGVIEVPLWTASTPTTGTGWAPRAAASTPWTPGSPASTSWTSDSRASTAWTPGSPPSTPWTKV